METEGFLGFLQGYWIDAGGQIGEGAFFLHSATEPAEACKEADGEANR